MWLYPSERNDSEIKKTKQNNIKENYMLWLNSYSPICLFKIYWINHTWLCTDKYIPQFANHNECSLLCIYTKWGRENYVVTCIYIHLCDIGMDKWLSACDARQWYFPSGFHKKISVECTFIINCSKKAWINILYPLVWAKRNNTRGKALHLYWLRVFL